LERRDVDLGGLKALAHPLRQRILYHLAFAGPATSTSIAEAFGESTGSASYHLRQLARFGFIEEDAASGNGRERWWRLVPLDLRGVTGDAMDTDEGRAARAELGRVRFERERSLIERYLANRHRFADFDDVAMFSSSATRLTKEEMGRFTEEYVQLLKRYWRPEEQLPPDAKPIALLFYAFPWPGE
jgi:DNA-binding transcriptional ArsR family regulator